MVVKRRTIQAKELRRLLILMEKELVVVGVVVVVKVAKVAVGEDKV
jgi:hypothetical protein